MSVSHRNISFDGILINACAVKVKDLSFGLNKDLLTNVMSTDSFQDHLIVTIHKLMCFHIFETNYMVCQNVINFSLHRQDI